MVQWSKWSKLKDKANASGYRIRRYSKNAEGKIQWDNYPTKNYAHLSLDEIDSLLNRLNASRISEENLAKERYNFNHAYINRKVLDLFESELESCMERAGVVANLNWLNVYVFKYFVLERKVSDPSKWHKIDTEWGKWLRGTHKDKQGRKMKLGIKTIVMIIQVANRFLTFLTDKSIYEEMDVIKQLKPLGAGKIKTIHALEAKPIDEGYIPAELFQKICKDNPDWSELPNFKLMYWYGLRISESLGLTRDSFRVGHLEVKNQGVAFTDGVLKIGPLKTRDVRKVPHWFVDPKVARSEIEKIKPMHPDTLNKEMNDFLKKYGLESHDCRRTFVTDGIEAKGIYETQMAAGHKDVRTTMKYQRDKRRLVDDLLD